MNKKELEHKIKDFEEILAITKTNIEAMELMRAEIRALLAEAEKPKLKHFDVILGANDEKGIVIGSGHNSKTYDTFNNIMNMRLNQTDARYCMARKLFNLKDLLVGEPLTEFEINNNGVSVDKNGYLWIGRMNRFCLGTINKEIINKLIRVYITQVKQGKE